MLEFTEQNEQGTVFKAVLRLQSDDSTKQGAIVVGMDIPATCVVAYANRHY